MSLQEELEREYREIQMAMTRKARATRRAKKTGEADDRREDSINPALCQSPTSPGPGLSSPSGSVSSRRTSGSGSAKSSSSPISSASSLNEQSTSPATTSTIDLPPFSSTSSSSPSSPPCVTFASRRSVELIRFFFNDYSPRILFTDFANDNDWKHLLLPLSFTNETFRNAICAFVSAHLEAMDIITGKGSLGFHRAALLGLSSQVHNEIPDAAASLATILLLIKYEALVGEDVSSIYSHLHAANNLLGLFQDTEDPTMTFLRRSFQSLDIMIALSQGCSAVGDSRHMSTTPSSPLHSPHSPRLEHPPDTIDQVFGVSADLWTILHRLCDLRPLLEELAAASSPEMMQDGNHLKAAVLRGELESLCSATEKALASWQPAPLSSQAFHHHALAYRDSALVHLYRAVYLLPSSHPAVQERCRSSLEHCVAAAAHPGAKALLWPLFVAACSAEGGDRAFARSAFEFIGKKQEMASTKRAWLVVTRAWAMMDGGGMHSSGLAVDVFPMTRNFGNMMSNAVMLW